MPERVHSVRVEGDVCLIEWQPAPANERTTTPYPLLWLRDHCPCPTCLHPVTRQRLVDTFTLPREPGVRAAEPLDGGHRLRIVWAPDEHASVYDAAFLRRAASAPAADFGADRVLWDARTLGGELPATAGPRVMEQDGALAEALRHLERYGLVRITGVEPTLEATGRLARRIAYVRETLFGGLWDVTADMAHKDTAYTTLAIGPHTDGTYSFDAPGYQMFHCLALDAEGGESTLVDGFHVAERLRVEAPHLYRILTEVVVPAQYIDEEEGVHLLAHGPVLRLDRENRMVQVRYNNHDRVPFLLEPERMRAFYDALAQLHRLANDPAHQVRRTLAPGEVLIFDNWRVLHGREAFRGYRRLAGAYLNKEDVESRLRVLRARGLA